MEGTAEHYEEEKNKGYLLQSSDDISGGYLIEKDHPDYYREEENGFILSEDRWFTIKEPQHAFREQVAYIKDCMAKIDALVQNEDSAVWERLDLMSFAKMFLVDEIALEPDTSTTSMFFIRIGVTIRFTPVPLSYISISLRNMRCCFLFFDLRITAVYELWCECQLYGVFYCEPIELFMREMECAARIVPCTGKR